MELKYKNLIKAFGELEEDNNIKEEDIKSALCEAIEKAYKKESGLDDIDVNAVLNEKKKTIDIYQNYTVVEDVEDDEFEISLQEAKELDKTAEIGSVVSQKVEFDGFSRQSVSVAKSIIHQKLAESKKKAIYNEYKSQINEMVSGKVESIRDRFVLVNLDDTLAVLPINQLIPVDGPEGMDRRERLTEGQIIRVVITDVTNPDDKGPKEKNNKKNNSVSVQVSRTCDMFVRRLFEKDVPEVYSGEVVIKALARDPGKRTKMAVMSKNPDVDAIGACIGPNGQRVKGITAELRNEKIDIFEWSEDPSELVKNALAPAVVEAVLPNPKEERSLIVVVAEDQLSLAIGKKGQNSKLANKLTGAKIDIKTRAQLENDGIDYETLVQEAEAKHAEYLKEVEKKQVARMEEAAKEQEAKNQEKLAKVKAMNQSSIIVEEEGFIPEEMQEEMSDKIANDIAMEQVETELNEEETPIEEVNVPETVVEVEEETIEEEKPTEEAMEEKVVSAKRKHADLEEMAEKNTYVSKFEKLTDSSKGKNDFKPKRKKKKSDLEENYKIDNKELEKQIKEKLAKTDNKPLYTEEELEEIEAQRQAEEDRELGIDDDYYDDEYDDYYDEGDM